MITASVKWQALDISFCDFFHLPFPYCFADIGRK